MHLWVNCIGEGLATCFNVLALACRAYRTGVDALAHVRNDSGRFVLRWSLSSKWIEIDPCTSICVDPENPP